jgi:ribosomal protein S4E
MMLYFEKIINEERGRKFRVHCRWQAQENKLDISLPSGEQIQEPKDFRKSKELKSRIEEMKVFKKLKFDEVEELKKSKIEEVEG